MCMQIFLQIFLLILGFAMLVKGADWLVASASAMAGRLGISKLVIGLTIVAMGTSAPEAAISISASVKGSAPIAIGNILGSNILNVLLILGVTAVITPLAVHETTVKYEIPFVFFVTVIFALLGLSDNEIGRFDGMILWVLFIAYFCYLYFTSQKHRKHSHHAGAGKPAQEPPAEGGKSYETMAAWKLILIFLIGLALIIFGSNLSVDAATKLAEMFGISKRVIGLTIVAIGTSLPELVTSVTAAVRKEADIAVGNIVGSNIFNILFVIGTASIITPVAYESKFLFDSIVAVAAIILMWLCVFLVKRRTLERWGGIIMFAAYAFYFGFLL